MFARPCLKTGRWILPALGATLAGPTQALAVDGDASDPPQRRSGGVRHNTGHQSGLGSLIPVQPLPRQQRASGHAALPTLAGGLPLGHPSFSDFEAGWVEFFICKDVTTGKLYMRPLMACQPQGHGSMERQTAAGEKGGISNREWKPRAMSGRADYDGKAPAQFQGCDKPAEMAAAMALIGLGLGMTWMVNPHAASFDSMEITDDFTLGPQGSSGGLASTEAVAARLAKRIRFTPPSDTAVQLALPITPSHFFKREPVGGWLHDKRRNSYKISLTSGLAGNLVAWGQRRGLPGWTWHQQEGNQTGTGFRVQLWEGEEKVVEKDWPKDGFQPATIDRHGSTFCLQCPLMIGAIKPFMALGSKGFSGARAMQGADGAVTIQLFATGSAS